MSYKFKSCFSIFLFLLSSCSFNVRKKEEDFFNHFFLVWKDETESIVLKSQGRRGYKGEGYVLYNGKRINVIVSFIQGEAAPWVVSEVDIWAENREDGFAFSFQKRRIKNPETKKYYDDRFELYGFDNRLKSASESIWRSDSVVLYSSPLPEEEMDARYFHGWSFFDKTNDVIFRSLSYSEHNTWQFKTDEKDLILSFQENRKFIIKNEEQILYNGTYIPHYEYIEFLFDEGQFFLNQFDYLNLKLITYSDYAKNEINNSANKQ